MLAAHHLQATRKTNFIIALAPKNKRTARKDHLIPLMLNASDGYIRKYTCDTIGIFLLKGRHWCLVPLVNVRPEEKDKIQYYLISDFLNHIKDVFKKSSDSLLYKIATEKKTKISVPTYLSMIITVEDSWISAILCRKKKNRRAIRFQLFNRQWWDERSCSLWRPPVKMSNSAKSTEITRH